MNKTPTKARQAKAKKARTAKAKKYNLDEMSLELGKVITKLTTRFQALPNDCEIDTMTRLSHAITQSVTCASKLYHAVELEARIEALEFHSQRQN